MNSILPRLHGTGQHRGKTAAEGRAELRDENAKLLARQTAADDFFRQLMDDRTELHNLWQYAEHKAACAEDVVACQEATIRDLERQVADLERRLQISVLAESASATTQELDVRDLPGRFATGPVVSFHNSPQAARPEHVPPWVHVGQPQPAT